jgi:enamine deaminase RidA (YjgF/YER057c/UK114 family)
MTSENEKLSFVQPEGWPKPKGYSNGAVVSGRTLFVAGQVGWNERGEFESDDLAEQFGKALDNVLAVVRAAGGKPEDIAKMTVYVTDLDAYRGSLPAVGKVWRERLGKHFPAMALLGVAGLVERRAKVEIEAVAVLGSP